MLKFTRKKYPVFSIKPILLLIGLVFAVNVFAGYPQTDTTQLKYPIKPEKPYQAPDKVNSGGIFLLPPSNLETLIEYDAASGEYVIKRKIGDIDYLPPVYMSPEEYRAYDFEQSIRQYWRDKRRSDTYGGATSLVPKLQVGGETFDRIFGGNTINIIPQGQANLTFGVTSNFIDNPNLEESTRRQTNLDYQSDIQLNVTGKIGEKLKLNVKYNTEATFDFENNVKIEYTGDEDEIIQKLEIGNVALPLEGSLITGSQSLFGFKTALKFGKLTVTSVFTQQKGQSKVIEVTGGAQTREFEITADDYDANRHFFLSHYFRDRYNASLQNLPILNSGVQITNVEVWITNRNDNFENSRDVVAFIDLAEGVNPETGESNIHNDLFVSYNGGFYPDNSINNLYSNLNNTYSAIRDIDQVTNTLNTVSSINIGTDYEKLQNARKLNANEFTINKDLGYISLNSALNNDEVLAVAFEYTVAGQSFNVGELSTGGITAPQTLIVKLLKGTNFNPKIKTWDLMMKNIYDIGAYQMTEDNFKMEIYYSDDQSGNQLPYIPEGSLNKQLLLSLLNLDNVNSSNDQYPDGIFDFIDGITVISSKGKIVFPVLEPFGSDLAKKFDVGEEALVEKYIYQELYDSTLTKARQLTSKNKFVMSGEYQSSSSSEIMLNALNIPQGSVVVTAGGARLTENVDYQVDYILGRVKIINPALLESGTPIQISMESNDFFAMQTKTLIGSHLNYDISKNFHVGATILNLTEKPITTKVNIGDEPISNTIWGLNAAYSAESQFVTTLLDKLPLIETKQASRFTFTGEFAHLIPGHSRLIDKDGIAYIDDFESSETSLDIKSWNNWKISSTPKRFQESDAINLEYNYNRARIAWYFIDRLFYDNNENTPGHIRKDPDAVSNHFVRQVFEKELFPNKDIPSGIPSYIPVLNIAYYPNERGPYNYVTNSSTYSDGLNPDGSLASPEKSWGGIMRKTPNSDFESSNYEYIEFWMMDPFVDNPDHEGGKIVFNLGNISEDILKDSRKSFESGLPSSDFVQNVDTTIWGRVPTIQVGNKNFSTDATAKLYQDVGLDGLGSINGESATTSDEYTYYSDYINSAQALLAGSAPQSLIDSIIQDPSADNYHYYRGTDYDEIELDILSRYKYYNGLEGNSYPGELSEDPLYNMSAIIPDSEDIDDDNTLSETDSYFEYEIELSPEQMEIGIHPYITDKINTTVTFANNEESEVAWYQFKIPIKEYLNKVGSIDGFSSIRFMRFYMTGFKEQTILRFAKMDLVRGEWRRFDLNFAEGSEGLTTPQVNNGTFEISAINFEENASRYPVNYILPPDISREIDPMNPQLTRQNEQSMVLRVRDLADGDAKAAYKNLNMDLRKYKHLKMDVHAEKFIDTELNDDELKLFIRLGSDYKENYYEYEVPLSLTPHLTDENAAYHEENDREIVWPDENRIDFDFLLLQQAKQARNDAMSASNSNISLNTVYSILDGKNKIKVAGNPNLSNVKVILIGIRNPGQHTDPSFMDDGLAKSIEVWVNELRLTDFDEDGGWAANGRLTANLADLGSVTIAGSTSTAGFGSIEKSVGERSNEDIYQYDISSTFELGKLFPDKFGVRLPLYIGYSETFINPQYNPLDPDIPLEAALKNAKTPEERDHILEVSQDYTKRRSINFTNIQVTPKSDKKNKKKTFYSISNFSSSFSYNETFFRNVNVEYNVLKNYRGAFGYNFMKNPKNIAPFSKTKLFKSKHLKLIKDFNFFLSPSQLNFRTDVTRKYNEIQTRNISQSLVEIPPSYQQEFMWNRNYTMKFDLTKQLKFTFNATNVARIDEPIGMVNKEINVDQFYHWRDSVVNNFINGGRNTSYRHAFDFTYSIPINKLPLLSWTNATVKYNATYNWDAAPILNSDLDFNPGNTISNSNSVQLNANANILNLYNAVPFLKKINQEYRRSRSKKKKNYKDVDFVLENVRLSSGRTKSINHNLRTQEVTIKVTDSNGKVIVGESKIISENKVRFVSSEDSRDAKIVVTGKVLDKENPFKLIIGYTMRMLMGLENFSMSYSLKQGGTLPGYVNSTRFMGSDMLNTGLTPGIPFILGWPNDRFESVRNEEGIDFGAYAARQGWLSTDTSLTAPFALLYNKNISYRSSIKPFNDFKIDLTGNYQWMENTNTYYIAGSSGGFNTSNPNNLVNGNFSISIISLGSAFEKTDTVNSSPSFLSFINNRSIIAERQASNRGLTDPSYEGSTSNPDGFSLSSQSVVIPAFYAAYTGGDANTVSLDKRPIFPMPNWTITYNGLTKIKYFKKYFKTFTVRHQYRSNFTIGSYLSNDRYFDNGFGFTDERNINEDFIDIYDYNNISIDEKFAPLINVDFTLNNSLTFRFESKKSRRVDLSLANNQITESKNDDLTIGIGYNFDEVPFLANNETVTGKLNLRGDFTYRKNLTMLRSMAEEYSTLTAGQRAFNFKFNADYIASKRLNIRFFITQDIKIPEKEITFQSSETYVGLSVRFNLAE